MSIKKATPPIKPRPPKEKEFQAVVVSYATARGWLVYHTYNSKRSAKGYPDLHLVRGPRSVFAELKRSGKERLKLDQEKWRDALLAAGQEWHLWTPEAWPDIREALA